MGRSSGEILYVAGQPNENESENIFTVDVQSNIVKQITNNSSEKIQYSFPIASHSGKRIAYILSSVSDYEYYDGEPIWKDEIHFMDIDGKNIEKISNIQMYLGDQNIQELLVESAPSWSPDDSKLAFSSNRAGLLKNVNFDEQEIFIINLQSYDIQQLTSAQGYSLHPSWSPDGNQITFMSNRDGDWEIYYMASDGTGNDVKITNNIFTDRYPSWANMSNRIIYHSDRDGNLNLYMYDFETEEEIRVTNHPANEYTARWSPDDKWIVYASDRDGDDEIFLMNLETKEEIKITDNNLIDGYQSWIP